MNSAIDKVVEATIRTDCCDLCPRSDGSCPKMAERCWSDLHRNCADCPPCLLDIEDQDASMVFTSADRYRRQGPDRTKAKGTPRARAHQGRLRWN